MVLGALEVLWWWGAAVGIWLITLSSVTVPEVAVAIGCGLPCGLAARAGRRALGNTWRPRPEWVLWIGPLAVSIIVDEVRVMRLAAVRLLGRPVGGELRNVPLPGDQPDTVASAHRALASVCISATPGTFVIDGDPEEDELVIHSLASGWPHLDRVVAR
jgi:multisubunit Na+/H+ antiporter MnhE subunit